MTVKDYRYLGCTGLRRGSPHSMHVGVNYCHEDALDRPNYNIDTSPPTFGVVLQPVLYSKMARRIQTILLGACLAFSSSSSLFADAWGFSPSRSRVFTTSGIVYGHSAPNASNVTEYLGIPYAQPPVGSLRFADPQAYSNRSRIIDGSAFAADCPTTNPGKYITNLSNAEWWATSMLYGDKPSEDCLFLNIWTPSGAKGNEGRGGREGREKGGLLPVMVWIYGGENRLQPFVSQFLTGFQVASVVAAPTPPFTVANILQPTKM